MKTNSTKGLTYADAGVDIDAGNALIDAIKPAAASTNRSGVMGSLGGFGALFDLEDAGFTDPILVAATDGVGTKLEIAIETGILDTIGIDLVAMCVNDLIVQGAEPLFFLDYFATGKLTVEEAAKVVEGIAEGCRQSGAALIGGETAEMPGFYRPGRFDLGGFCVGAAERGTLLPRPDMKPGDVVLGLASDGFHSNGFSLVRKLVEKNQATFSFECTFSDNQTFGEALLTPTRLYIRQLLPETRTGRIKAMAHITGGGLTENIPRVLPDNLAAEIDLAAWSVPPCFRWARTVGGTADSEMLRTFNMGIGMCLIVAPDHLDIVKVNLAGAGETVIELGALIEKPSEQTVIFQNQLNYG